ncbi:MAG: hypothetical protein ABWY25_03415 [Paenisporosarcina sp.]
MSSTQPARVTSLRGRVTTGLHAKGSKSEHEAIFIETANGRYVLRRKKGPAFGDPELRQYVGHEVECDGFLIGMTLLAERIEVVD